MTKQDTFELHLLNVAKLCAGFTEDIAKAMLGFIPNGLNLLYDFVLKPLPVLGKFFAHRWVEQVIKLCSGITIGQGLAADLAYYVFRPIGFAIGFIIGGLFKRVPQYHGQVGKVLYRLSAQTVGGAFLWAACFIALQMFYLDIELNLSTLLLAMAVGGILSLIAKGVLLVAVHSVTSANAAAARKNVQRAKELNGKLKVVARLKAKSIILRQAQDVVQQMNGPQSQPLLESFFEETYESIASPFYQKLDRHFNYLTDRACHGDLSSLKRLQDLTLKTTTQTTQKPPFEILVERMFNARTLFRLKDDVDTAYDRWQYRFLSVKNAV